MACNRAAVKNGISLATGIYSRSLRYFLDCLFWWLS